MKTKIMNFKNVKPFAITTALIGSSLFGYWAFGADETSPSAADYDVATLNTAEPIFIDSLTLVNESLEQTLSLLGQWTNKILVPSSNLPKASINLDIQVPLTRSEAIAVLKSALTANGVAVTPMGDKALRVVPSNRAKSSSPALKDRAELSTLPGSQEICSVLYRLNNLTAREAARIITPWVTPLTSSVVTLDKANSLLVTDA